MTRRTSLFVVATPGALACLTWLALAPVAAQGRPGGPPGKAAISGKAQPHGGPTRVGKPAQPGEQGQAPRTGRGGKAGEHGREPSAHPGESRSFEVLQRNPQLAERLRTLLPGQDLQAAAAGFRNLGQFVAAAHVAHNLGIPFDQLKAKMVGERMSLGEAIRALRPEVDAKAAARQAEEQARRDLRTTSGGT